MVLKHIKNDLTKELNKMIFEEEDGSTIEVPITAMAIAKYTNDDRYYLFLCDKNWDVQNDYLLDNIEESMEFAETNFGICKGDWLDS
ncbi:hypothetical protein [Neobacillus cucumis]|uniref:hypothetical protein n=1 Tax=Neobacillus cucumis TaxID=1740721 RepID=UPI001EF7DBED|nr:hypothetical protein [Neobacillus cucumis]MBM7656407.1 hypothetical protein [Neobacillus cucumis]